MDGFCDDLFKLKNAVFEHGCFQTDDAPVVARDVELCLDGLAEVQVDGVSGGNFAFI